MLNQLITDMRTQLAKAKQEVAGAIADEKKLQAEAEREKKQAEEWERRAMLAVQENRDDLAKQALVRYNEHLQGAQQLHETWSRQRAETELLKNSLRQLNDKIEEAKRAEAQQRIQETMSSMSDKSALESFERMAEKIEDRERKALAAAELTEDLSGDTLNRQFESLEYKGSVDQQLAALKEKMGALGAGKPPESRQIGSGRRRDAADADLVENDEERAG
jgi:phage shock protein A